MIDVRIIRWDADVAAYLVTHPDGYVHSVYDKVVNLLMGDRIVALMYRNAEDAPDSMITDYDKSWKNLGNLEGLPVTYADNILYIGDLDGKKIAKDRGERLLFHTEGATGYVSYLSENQPRFCNMEICNRIDHLLEIYGKQDALYRAFYHKTGQDVMQDMFREILDYAEETCNATEYFRKALAMMGLGIGLTPSGDDCLAGMALVFHYMIPGFCEHDELGICRMEKRSNRISLQMLQNAIEGRARRSELALLEAIETAPDRRLVQAVHDILNFGETSGTDTLIGMLAGLRRVARLEICQR